MFYFLLLLIETFFFGAVFLILLIETFFFGVVFLITFLAEVFLTALITFFGVALAIIFDSKFIIYKLLNLIYTKWKTSQEEIVVMGHNAVIMEIDQEAITIVITIEDLLGNMETQAVEDIAPINPVAVVSIVTDHPKSEVTQKKVEPHSPTVSKMISSNQRLLLKISNPSRRTSMLNMKSQPRGQRKRCWLLCPNSR